MHTQIDRFFKNFFEKIYPPHLFEPRSEKMGVFSKDN